MLESRRQLENTRVKLCELQELYASKKQIISGDRVRALRLRSVKQRINQFKEGFACFESRANSFGISEQFVRRFSLLVLLRPADRILKVKTAQPAVMTQVRE